MKKFDGITRKYREVEISDNCYTENGEQLYRVETKGKTGRVLYGNLFYLLSDGKERQIFGMGGSTGHGWGGLVAGYVTKEEAEKYGIRI